MFYNIELKKPHKITDCFTCRFFNQTLKKCEGGINKVCFLYDEKTRTCIDGKTGLHVNFKK